MSEYKGFITWKKFNELKDILDQISENRGLLNKFEHLYSPDTDMNDKICEDLNNSKLSITLDIYRIMQKCITLGRKVLEIEEN